MSQGNLLFSTLLFFDQILTLLIQEMNYLIPADTGLKNYLSTHENIQTFSFWYSIPHQKPASKVNSSPSEDCGTFPYETNL